MFRTLFVLTALWAIYGFDPAFAQKRHDNALIQMKPIDQSSGEPRTDPRARAIGGLIGRPHETASSDKEDCITIDWTKFAQADLPASRIQIASTGSAPVRPAASYAPLIAHCHDVPAFGVPATKPRSKSGATKNWIPSGWGGSATVSYKRGTRYSGSWEDGWPHGKGTAHWPDGSSYIGWWQRGIIHGWGEYTWANGDRYIGPWHSGKRHGRGVYIWADGSRFVGHYRNGKPQSEGHLKEPGRKWLSGRWRQGCLRHGNRNIRIDATKDECEFYGGPAS